MGDSNQKEHKETILSMIVIRDFKLGRDSTKEENIINGDHVDEGKSRMPRHQRRMQFLKAKLV